MTFPEENTLGVIVGAKPGKRETDAAGRAIRAVTPRRSSLGTGFIGIGAAVICGLRAIYGLFAFAGQWDVYPNPAPALAAWIILTIAMAATFIAGRIIGDYLPHWLFAAFLAALATAVGLDLYAIWPLENVGLYASAALTAGLALLIVLTLRNPVDIVISVGALAIVLATSMTLTSSLTFDKLDAQITALAFAVLPAVIGVFVVAGFRRLVQVELDRVLVQSTVSAPRFAVGMMASEELARLDLAAEDLLDLVATGKTKLPLDPKTASVAASLATELRLHLIEGRRETWLYHAITESDMLGKSVTLTDKGSLAGLLDPAQRDGLLSTAWLLVSDTSKGGAGRTVQLTVGPATTSIDTPEGRRIAIPIVITTTAVARNRVDPATWAAIKRVGAYSDSTQNSSLRVEIECHVENPADQ